MAVGDEAQLLTKEEDVPAGVVSVARAMDGAAQGYAGQASTQAGAAGSSTNAGMSATWSRPQGVQMRLWPLEEDADEATQGQLVAQSIQNNAQVAGLDGMVPHATSSFDGVVGADPSEIVYEVIRTRFRSLVMGDGKMGKIVFFCAETGMGKTWLCRALLTEMRCNGAYTSELSLEDSSSEEAANKLIRFAREVRAANDGVVTPKAVLIDDVPPLDECDFRKATGALERLVAMGTLVLVSLLPEAEMLAEELPESLCVRSRSLAELYQLEPTLMQGREASSERGIGALVVGPAMRVAPDGSVNLGRDAWLDALSGLLSRLVRPSLTREEQDLRLVMLLLGEGTFDDLRQILCRLDGDMLEQLRLQAPHFGVDRMSESFSCVGIQDLDTFAACADSLRETCARLPGTTRLAARALADRQNFARLAVVCELCDAEGLATIGCTWGVELICEGHLPVVRKAFAQHKRLQMGLTAAQDLALRALSILTDSASVLRELKSIDDLQVEEMGLEGKKRLVELLEASRNLDRGLPCDSAMRNPVRGPMARTLMQHVKARSLLLAGRFVEAYALLVNDPTRLAPANLPGALLCDDFQIAQALVGEQPGELEREACQIARRVLKATGVKRIACYQEILGPVLAVLTEGGQSLGGAEEVVARASRMGDRAVQAVMLLALAVLDNRSGAFSRAHVRAVQAHGLVDGPAGDYLRQACQLVDALAAMGLGDEKLLNDIADGGASVIRDVAAYMACHDGRSAAAVRLTSLSPERCSRDALWLLNMLCNDFSSRSTQFKEWVPSSWSALSRRAQRRADNARRRGQGGENKRTASAKAKPTPALVPVKPAVDSPTRVRLMVLGDFKIVVNDTYVVGLSLGRRRARSLMTFLAICRGHAMRRYDLVECIWPEADFMDGRQRVYEAASIIRRLMRRSCGSRIEPFLGNRTDGVIALDPDVVSCDVDDFERLAKDVLSEDNDEAVVNLVVQVVELYRGDLCETPFDATGLAESRRQELRGLFVDASIAGARAALREDLTPLAVRLAWGAHLKDGLREDVALVLVEALKAAGRSSDARDAYRNYARHVLEETGEPPSARLRAAVSRLFSRTGRG